MDITILNKIINYLRKIIKYVNLATRYIYVWGITNFISICIAQQWITLPSTWSQSCVLEQKNTVTTFLVNVNSNCVLSGKCYLNSQFHKEFHGQPNLFFPIRIKRQTNVMNSQLYKSKRLNKYMLNCLEVYTINRILTVYLALWILFHIRWDLSHVLTAKYTAVMSDQ
jgi:hypothetical protein